MSSYTVGDVIAAGFGFPDGYRVTEMEVVGVSAGGLECRVPGYSFTVQVAVDEVVSRLDGSTWNPVA